MASRPSRQSKPALRQAYRIADRRHKIFEGEGAALLGGRWNSPGRRVIYAAETYAGAMLELLASANIGRMPKHHVWIEILIGEDVSVDEVDAGALRRWDAPDQRTSRMFGDTWYAEKRSTVLIVPSAVVRMERNVVINQEHPGFRKLRASAPKPVVWDQRLFR
ncbi:MAG: RES domain-containing protein [Bryobacteraceae bacterium]|jgi:RES domain-containing protein